MYISQSNIKRIDSRQSQIYEGSIQLQLRGQEANKIKVEERLAGLSRGFAKVQAENIENPYYDEEEKKSIELNAVQKTGINIKEEELFTVDKFNEILKK